MSPAKSSIKTIVVLVILLLVGVLGVLGMNTVKTYMSGASAGSEPKVVKVVPSDRSAQISWVSDKATMGVLEYGTTPASLLLRSLETSATTSHFVEIKPLKANVSYYFRIRVGDEVYDNNGIPWSFKTKNTEKKESSTPVVPTVAVSGMKIVPTASLQQQSAPKKVDCDSNGDGLVSTIEKLKCPDQSKTEKKKSCDSDGDGMVTSIEKLKCGQN